MDRPMYLAVDFDHTLCLRTEHGMGKKGKPNKNIIELVNKLHTTGKWKIILWTVRGAEALDEAVEWCEKHNVHLDYVNENPEAAKWFEKFDIPAHAWSVKIFADFYLDDSALSPFNMISDAHGILDYQSTHIVKSQSGIDALCFLLTEMVESRFNFFSPVEEKQK